MSTGKPLSRVYDVWKSCISMQILISISMTFLSPHPVSRAALATTSRRASR